MDKCAFFVAYYRGLERYFNFIFAGRKISREKHFAGGKFRELPFAVDFIFAGGKFRAKSKFANTLEPLTNDHPHQRPSLSYDHISCDGQWFLFVYESLTSDHPSYTTTPMWFWGWSYKRGSTAVKPLSNDHPHQRPSLSYDHISCVGQGFLFVYESLTSDHPSYTTTPVWFWGWSYKRGSTV